MGEVVVASVAFSIGGIFMKQSDGFTRIAPSFVVVALFVAGAALMSRAVRTHGMSGALVLGLGVEAITAVAVGVALLHERVSPVQFGGIALVVAGVALLRL